MRVFVAAWVGSTNLGDELIFHAMTAKLKARGVDVATVSVDPAGTLRDHGVAAVPSGAPLAILRAISRSDGLIFGGGGVVQDDTSLLNLPYHLSRPLVARLTRRPRAGIGLGAGPVTRPGSGALTRLALHGLVACTARDAHSVAEMEHLGIAAELSSDLVFSLPTPPATAADAIAVCLRPYRPRGGLLPVSRRDIQPDEAYVAALAKGLNETAKRTSLPLRLIAMDRVRDAAFQAKVAERLEAPHELAVPDLRSVAAEVAASRLVIATRYHGGLLGVATGRPTVMIGYAPKTESLAAEMGSAGALVDNRPETFADLPVAATGIIDRALEAVETAERLRQRERINDAALDRLLDAAARRCSG